MPHGNERRALSFVTPRSGCVIASIDGCATSQWKIAHPSGREGRRCRCSPPVVSSSSSSFVLVVALLSFVRPSVVFVRSLLVSSRFRFITFYILHINVFTITINLLVYFMLQVCHLHAASVAAAAAVRPCVSLLSLGHLCVCTICTFNNPIQS